MNEGGNRTMWRYGYERSGHLRQSAVRSRAGRQLAADCPFFEP
jgi:hypothetical protein